MRSNTSRLMSGVHLSIQGEAFCVLRIQTPGLSPDPVYYSSPPAAPTPRWYQLFAGDEHSDREHSGGVRPSDPEPGGQGDSRNDKTPSRRTDGGSPRVKNP